MRDIKESQQLETFELNDEFDDELSDEFDDEFSDVLEDAVEGIIECRWCGNTIEPDAESCSCGWKNPLVQLGLI